MAHSTAPESLIDAIRAHQTRMKLDRLAAGETTLGEHRPEMLYFGCVDARLDPIGDIGIRKGKAIIFRSIAAMVAAAPALDKDVPPGGNSVGAVLEFFLNHLPAPVNGNCKHIVVSAHTDCGGLKACLKGGWDLSRDRYLPAYLDVLDDVKEGVLSDARAGNWDFPDMLAALERESVRRSLANLQSYPVVRHALEAGAVEVHGWVLNTHDRTIFEMDPATKDFHRMSR